MPEPEKILLIHGIAMRSEAKVAKYAASLSDLLGEQYQLVPVYWGDLGADDTHLPRVIGRHAVSSADFRTMVQQAIMRPAIRSAGRARAWVERRRGDRHRSTVINKAYKQHSDTARSQVRGYLGDKFRSARLWLTQQTLPFIADVIVYQSHTYRAKIQQRVREVIERELGPDAGSASQPIKVVAHSLGGVVTFDMACANENPLHLKALVTLGSQPAFFHLLDPREDLDPYQDEQPVTLPPTIRAWTNVWDEYDMLAFATGEVFRLHDGSIPKDVRVRATRSRLRGGLMMRSHLSYFTQAETAEAIIRTMAACES